MILTREKKERIDYEPEQGMTIQKACELAAADPSALHEYKWYGRCQSCKVMTSIDFFGCCADCKKIPVQI